MKVASAQEAINGNSNDTVITPLRLKQVLKNSNISGTGGGGITTEKDPVFLGSAAAGISVSNIEAWDNKQELLVSGTNIKTINGETILGKGDLIVDAGCNAILSPTEPTTGEDIWVQYSPNLFNKETATLESRIDSSGTVTDWTTSYYPMSVSDFIEVEPNTDYTIQKGSTYEDTLERWYNFYYDENYSPISGFQVLVGTYTITTPSNAKYMRFTVSSSLLSEFQFEKGSTASSYMPYAGANRIMVKNGEKYYELYDKELPNKQNTLISGTNIKTINGETLLGEGDITIAGGIADLPIATDTTLGAIIVGDNLDIDESGVLSSNDSVPINSIFEYEGDDIPDGYAEIIGESEDGTMGGLVDTYDLLQYVYPVGSIFISNTNTNPSTFMGGEWKLIDKGFSDFYGSDTGEGTYFTKNETNVDEYNIYFTRSNKRVTMRLMFKNLVALSDSTVNIGTLLFNKLGFSQLYHSLYSHLGGTDGGNAVIQSSLIYNTGVINIQDIVHKTSVSSSATVAIGSEMYIEYDFNIPMNYMLDEACDKFYWKRTA